MNTPKKTAIIGAGWAGLAAAARLAPHGETVLFEAGRVAGGRARAVAADGLSFADNGQHLLIGAYGAVWSLLREVGVDIDAAFLRQPLQWYLHDGVRFQAAAWLPAPLNLLVAVLTAEHATWSEKILLIRQMQRLQRHHRRQGADQSVAAWLADNGGGGRWRNEFWQPMVWGALNTPLETASVNTLCAVLADGVWARRAHSDYWVPKTDLGSVFAEPVLDWARQHGARFVPQCRVGRILPGDCGRLLIEGETFDAAVLAVAPYHLSALLPETEAAAPFQAALAALSYHAITTVYLRYAAPLNLPALMTGFADGTAQWLIDRRRLNGSNEIAAVISLSDHQGSLKADDWIERVHQDVLRVCPDAAAPLAAQVITEKRATTACTPKRTLPDAAALNRQGIFVAGDWIHPRYPATLEAAVQSGQHAAASCLHYLQAA